MKLRISLLLFIVGVDTCNTVVAADTTCNSTILKPDDSVDCDCEDSEDSGGDNEKRKFGKDMEQNATPPMYWVTEEDNKPFACLLRCEELPICETSTDGVKGQKIFPSKHFRKGSYGYESEFEVSNILEDIGIHTPGNKAVKRKDFHKWTRWYQEYGNTQIFRMHSGEYKVDGDRRGRSAGRIEAELNDSWTATETGTSWKRYTGTFTIVKANDSTIFQVFTSGRQWSVHLDVDRSGNLRYKEREGGNETYPFGKEESVIGRPFNVTVCDNGKLAEIFIDGKSMSNGTPYGDKHNRKNGETHFRWGTYVSSTNRNNETNKAVDSLMFVAGSRVDDVEGKSCGPTSIPTNPTANPTASPTANAPVLGPMPYCPVKQPDEGDKCERDNQKCGYVYRDISCNNKPECRATKTYKCKDGKWKLKKEVYACLGEESCNPCHTGNAPDPNKDCTDIFNVGYKCAGNYEDTSCDGEPAQCTPTVDYICKEEGDWKRKLKPKSGKSCKWSKSKSSDKGKGGKNSDKSKNSNKNKNSDKNKGPDKGKGGKGPDKGKGKGGNDNDCPAKCCGAKVCKSDKSKGCKSYKSTRRGLRQ